MLRRTAIARPPFQRGHRDDGKNLRINERIRRNPVRLIGADNEQIGVIDTFKALQMAREVQLDLVEVAPTADPPVCRIMDYGKWKYQQKKKEQKAKVHSKQSELKEVRLRPGTDDHDVDIKLHKALEFIAEGHKVQFTIMFKGRQMAHRELGFELCKRIAEQFGDKAHPEQMPRMMGRRMTMMMVPGPKTGKDKTTAKPAPRPSPAPAATAVKQPAETP